MLDGLDETRWYQVSPEVAYVEAERRIQEALEQGAALLDLGDLPLEILPPQLGELTRLKGLALGMVTPPGQWNVGRPRFRGSDLTPLANLQSLTSLNLSGCWHVTDLTPLANLQSLTSLNLSGCWQVTNLTPLANLQSLTSLKLIWCEQVTDLAPLANLQSLTSLDLSWCQQVTDLSPLANLLSLTSLDLSWCQQVTDLTPLLELRALESLDWQRAGKQSFEQLRPLLGQFRKLYLHGTKFDDLAVELTGTIYENVLDKVRAHYADLAGGAATETELKVFVLGNGHVGKTQLVRQLLGEMYDESVKTTHGIQCRQRVESQLAGWKQVSCNLWDFGGQDIYHGSHALFLHGQAVFLLLWTPHSESGEYLEAGTTMRNQPLAYWLDYVHTLAGSQAPVLVIQSQCDTRQQEKPANIPVEHEFAYLRQVPFSAKHQRGLEELKGQLRSAAAEVLQRYQKIQIGKGRAAVRQRLRDLLLADQRQPATERTHRTLAVAEYERLCQEVQGSGAGTVSSPSALLDFLHQSGVVYYQQQLFGGQIILDQEWALEAIYTLFHRDEVYPHLLRQEGRFTRQLLHDLIWGREVNGKGPYTEQEQKTFLGMMQSCGICFRANPERDEQGKEIEAVYAAPALLPDWSTLREQVYHWTERTPADAEATLSYRFLHEGVFRGLLAKIGEHAGPRANYARQGCGFYDQRTQTTIVMESLSQPTASNPGAGQIRLRACVTGYAGFLPSLN